MIKTQWLTLAAQGVMDMADDGLLRDMCSGRDAAKSRQFKELQEALKVCKEKADKCDTRDVHPFEPSTALNDKNKMRCFVCGLTEKSIIH